jgi:hypothetical protein
MIIENEQIREIPKSLKIIVQTIDKQAIEV